MAARPSLIAILAMLARRRGLASAAGIVALGGAGCSLLVDTSGLSGAANDADAAVTTVDDAAASQVDAETGTIDAGHVDGDAAASGFVDDFGRPDDDDLGNEWTQRNPHAFQLRGHRAEKGATSNGTNLDYVHNFVFRPKSELPGDVTVVAEFPFVIPTYPQVLARASFTGADDLVAYDLYIDGNAHDVLVARLGATGLVVIGMTTSAPGFMAGVTYRLTLRVQGTSPVAFNATVEEQLGSPWKTRAVVSGTDGDDGRIQTPGLVGFSADDNPGYVYSRFEWQPAP